MGIIKLWGVLEMCDLQHFHWTTLEALLLGVYYILIFSWYAQHTKKWCTIRVRALIRISANQGMPAKPVWAARMRRDSPYAYGEKRVRDGTRSTFIFRRAPHGLGFRHCRYYTSYYCAYYTYGGLG